MTVTMGVHYRWQIPDVVRDQLRLAHALREDLVSMQLDYDAAIKAIWSSYPQVAAVEQALFTAENEAAAATEAVLAERVRQRTKRVTGPAADRITTARGAVKQARQSRRDAIAAVYGEATDRISHATDELRSARKQLYAKYCQNNDGPSLFWATHNFVVDQHNALVNRIKQARAAGRPAQLRHHRFTGTGTIAVQLQRSSTEPPRTPAVLADPNGKYRNVLLLPWTNPDQWNSLPRSEQRRHGRATVRMRCGSVNGTPVRVEIPVQQHRMLVADADVTTARLTVTRTAGHLHARLAVTANIPGPTEPDDGPAIAVHLGWSDTDTGTQVATWRSSTPITVPDKLQPTLTAGTGGTTGTVVMPHRITTRLAHADQLRSQRSRAFDTICATLAAWLTNHGPIPHPTRLDETISAGDVARWRSPARAAALALAWRDTPPANGVDIATALEAWRRDDRKLWEKQEHTRGKTRRHRTDLYRNIAAALTQQAGHIVVDDSSIATLATLPSDLPAEVATRVAHRRTISAPGSLRAALTATATRNNIPITIVPAAGLSRTHATCGHHNPADDRYRSHTVTCDGCGGTYNPDTSATLLMLHRATDTNPPPSADPDHPSEYSHEQ